MDVISGDNMENICKTNAVQKCELKSNAILHSDKRIVRIADNSRCLGKGFNDREGNNEKTAKNNIEVMKTDTEKDHNLASNEKKTYALPSSQFHARFADLEDNSNDEYVVQRANSSKINDKNVIKQSPSNASQTKIIDSMASQNRLHLSNQKSNNTIPSTVEFKTSTIRQHYYPEGSWGWVVVVCVMFCHIIMFGLQLSFGIFLMHLNKQSFGYEKYMSGICLGSLSLAISQMMSPVIVSWCRKKSARLTAIAGGLISSLGCLFASFASQFHQILLSYGIFMSIGIGIARESSDLMIGQYFKRKRGFVEIFVQSSIGIGVALMAPFLNWSIGSFRHWRAGLQLIACTLFSTFIIAILYRPASLYHPQRRAILHLKTQRRKIREKNPQTNKPPFFDLTPLKIRSLQIILVSTVLFSLGYLSPLFYLTSLVTIPNTTSEEMINIQDVVIPSPIINLYVYFGISFTIGVIGFGFLTVNKSAKCQINPQYLCQTSMIFTVFLLMASIYLNDYYSYVIFAIAYGIAVGSFHYTNKMLVFSLLRAKTFGKALSYVKCGQSVAILLGIPITGYINNWFEPNNNHYGFLFSTMSCLAGCLVLFALKIDSQNILANINPHKELSFHHSCNTSEANHLYGMAANVRDSVKSETPDNHCCNCGEKLLLNEESDDFKEYQNIKADECRPSSPKRSRVVDDDEEEDEDFHFNKLQAQDLATFFSEDLYNYYLQNDGEEEMALYDPERELVKERMAENDFECEISTIDCSQQRKNLLINSNDPKNDNFLKRTIETVAEEASSIV